LGIIPPGRNISFPHFKAKSDAVQVVQIPLIAGVALTKVIRETVPLKPVIKWPNDIVIGKKKVGGILTEMSSEIDGVNYVVLGIGLNVNMRAALFDENICDIATSLIDECGKYTSRVNWSKVFCVSLN